MKIGFIGCGNMASAMIQGITGSGEIEKEQVMASAKTEKTRKAISEKLQIQAAANNREVVQFADIIFLAVKPQYLEEVLSEIKDEVRQDQIYVSIAPGKTLEWLAERLGENTKIIRTMPNTPAMVGAGMTALCYNELVTEEEVSCVCRLCDTFGKTEVVSEHLMDVVVGVSGSSPAYVFMFLEAMADAAVADGMPRAQAYQFAAQSVMGSAKLMLETGKHPGELKDMVCSPGGTTIEAVRVLEEKGLRSAVIEGQKACVRKAKGM
ncbi:MAG: pyrroline-5-carboxylate reductase [Muricoprocola sp.]